MNSEPQSSGNLIGTVLLGRYRVVRELAKGGMGVVYLARAEGAVGFVKPYVIKLVLPEHADNERFVSMFVREANILANLRHPGIVSVVELGERDEDGALVMVLEYVRGYHLGQWAKYVRLTKRTIPVENILQLMIEVLDALHYAHSMAHPDGTPMGIVHRDISPSNILLDEDGRARLLDFGVARMRGANQEYHTQVKSFVGKLMYSAPELFAEADASAQSDCYSCGVVLHEILLGRNTFRAESQAATLNRVLNHLPERLEPLRKDVPSGLDAVLQKALAKLPSQRYRDAREFAVALRTLQRIPESDARAHLAALLKQDFSHKMAEMLGLESLADRDEAWRRLSHLAPTRISKTLVLESGSHASVGSKRPTGPMRVGTPATLPENDVVRVARIEERPRRSVPPPPPPTRRAQPRPPWQTLGAFAAGLLVAIAAVSGIVFALQRPPPTPALPQIRVVTEPGGTAELSPGRPDDERDVPGVDSAAPSDERKERSVRGPDPLSLTRAFRKQQGRIETCFTQHVQANEAPPAMQLEFDLSSAGRLNAVRLQPSKLRSTPLGRCLEQVANDTRFPPQGRAVSFAIPITASRTSSR